MPFDFAIGGTKWPGTSKLIEEMGELQQVLAKLIQLDGGIIHWDGALDSRLIEEFGDVRAAMIFFCSKNGISKEAVHGRAAMKLHKFEQWHLEQGKEHAMKLTSQFDGPEAIEWQSPEGAIITCRHAPQRGEQGFPFSYICNGCMKVVQPDNLDIVSISSTANYCCYCARLVPAHHTVICKGHPQPIGEISDGAPNG